MRAWLLARQATKQLERMQVLAHVFSVSNDSLAPLNYPMSAAGDRSSYSTLTEQYPPSSNQPHQIPGGLFNPTITGKRVGAERFKVALLLVVKECAVKAEVIGLR